MRDLSHLNLSERSRMVLALGYPNANMMDESGWREAIRKYANRAALLELDNCDKATANEVLAWAWKGYSPLPMSVVPTDHYDTVFSTRTRNCLRNDGMITAKTRPAELALAIAGRDDMSFLRIPNFGRKSLAEVRVWAASILNDTTVFEEMRNLAHSSHKTSVKEADHRLAIRLQEIAELEARSASLPPSPASSSGTP